MYVRFAILGTVLAYAAVGTGHCTGLADSPALQRSTACMVEVLRTEPRAQSPESGVLRVDQLSKGATEPAPFVRYTWEQDHQVTFAASREQTDLEKFYFLTVLGGAFGAGQTGPDDMGTSEITKLWKERCGVTAVVLYL